MTKTLFFRWLDGDNATCGWADGTCTENEFIYWMRRRPTHYDKNTIYFVRAYNG